MLIKADHGASHGDVRQGQALTDEEGMMEQVIVQSGHGFGNVLLGPFGAVFVELHNTEGGKDPSAGGRQDVRVSKVQPLEHL